MSILHTIHFSDAMHKALRTKDLVEIIFSLLDVPSLEAVCQSCQLWQQIVSETLLWKKLAQKLSRYSLQNLTVLSSKGLNERFQDHTEEAKHFRELCLKFTSFSEQWRWLEPSEVLLNCSPEAVNRDFNFKWDPWWWWKNQGGWIASFAIDQNNLLCGVIETLQLWDLSSNTCVSILSTPRDDYVQGVDIALNCLDLLSGVAVSGSNEGVIRVWDVNTNKLSSRLDCTDYGAVNSVKLVSQGEGDAPDLLLSGHDDGQLSVWRIISCSNILLLSIISSFDNILWCIDTCSKYIAVCSEDSRIGVYNRKHFEVKAEGEANENNIKYLDAHKDAVTCVSVTDQFLISGSRDHDVNIWKNYTAEDDMDLHSDFQLLWTLGGHEEILHFVAQDDDRIYSSDDGGELFVWDKKKVISGETIPNKELILRRVDYGEERGAIDCIKVIGTKLYLSYDDFGSIAIQDFW